MNSEYEDKGKKPGRLQYVMPFAFAVMLVFGVILGFFIRGSSSGKPSVLMPKDTDKIKEILRYVNNRYVDSVDSDILFEDAVNEIFKHLDPHSVYISAAELQAVNESLRGEFDGIGIEFNLVDDTIMVVSPLAGGPSEEVGIVSGDKIIMVEDSLVAGINISNTGVMKLLKGRKGTKVKISVMRVGEEELLDFVIRRDKIVISSILAAYMMDDVVGYIRISQFSRSTAEEFRNALKFLTNNGMEKLIIDLRDNGGGYLDASTKVADELLDDNKLIVYTEGRAYLRENKLARKDGLFEEGDLCILINEGSASASEIVAGAIQDWNRGTIIGRRSYGKGLVQDQIKLEDGSAIRLTIARYYTPKGRSIQRSYTNGVDNYHEEYVSRLVEEYENNDTSVNNDSISWGIMPEVYLPVDTTANLLATRRLLAKGLIQTFAYSLYSNDPEEFSQYVSPNDFRQNYELDQSDLAQFIADNQQHVKYDIEKASSMVEVAIKAYIARQLFYLDGYYPIINGLDPEVRAAYNEITGGRVTMN